MRNIIGSIFLFSSIGIAAQTLKSDSIGYGKLLHIDGKIQLPKGQKLNKAAHSKIEMYEKNQGEWLLIEKISLNDFFGMTELINFQKPIRLSFEKSEVKMKASLHHCPAKGRGICIIDDYEGYVKRSNKKVTSEIKVTLNGSNP